jgi:chromosome segregation ATPase
MTPNAQTLSQRLAAGRLSSSDTLRYGLQIVDALRHAHEEGCCHGALTPDAVVLTGTGVELVPPQPGAVEALTPYTAPERIAGHPPDPRTDIFSLGALLYEMFTGRRAFAGENAGELAAAIENSMPEAIGDTALDRLVFNCLVKDPAGRWQRVQQVHMEFKILLFSARRAQAAALPHQPDPVLQAEVRMVESRLTSRLEQQYAEATADLRHLSVQLPLLESHLTSRLEQQYGEATAELRHVAAELPLLESHLVSRLEQRYGEASAGLQHLSAEVPLLESRLTSRLERHEGALTGLQQAVAEIPSRLEQHEGALTGLQQAVAEIPSRLERHEGALTGLQRAVTEIPSRLERHEGALSGLQQAVAEIPSRLEQHEGALTGLQQAVAELPQLESRLTSRIERHEASFAGLQQAAADLSHMESRLASRLEQQEGALTGLYQAAAELPRLTLRLEDHEGTLAGLQKTAAELPQLESRLTTRLERHKAALESVQQVSAEQTSVLEIVSQTLSTVQERMLSLDAQLAASHERAGQPALAGEIQAIQETVKSQADAIESIRAAMARTDDFMERVVEALESLQTMVLEQARERAVA